MEGCEIKKDLKKEMKGFLEKVEFLPINEKNKKYKYTSVKHTELDNYNGITIFDEDKKDKYIDKKIKGIYIYKLGNNYIYIGKGNPIRGRLIAHYKESFDKVNNEKFCEFWRRYKDKKFDIYYQEQDNEICRKILEMMLIYVLDDDVEFERFNKEWKEKRSKSKAE